MDLEKYFFFKYAKKNTSVGLIQSLKKFGLIPYTSSDIINWVIPTLAFFFAFLKKNTKTGSSAEPL